VVTPFSPYLCTTISTVVVFLLIKNQKLKIMQEITFNELPQALAHLIN
jgi:hypothetical protein